MTLANPVTHRPDRMERADKFSGAQILLFLAVFAASIIVQINLIG